MTPNASQPKQQRTETDALILYVVGPAASASRVIDRHTQDEIAHVAFHAAANSRGRAHGASDSVAAASSELGSH